MIMSLLCLKTSVRLLQTPCVPSGVLRDQNPASVWAFSHWVTHPPLLPMRCSVSHRVSFHSLNWPQDLSFLNFTLFICSDILLPMFFFSFSQNIMLLSKLNFIANAELDVPPVRIHSILHSTMVLHITVYCEFT